MMAIVITVIIATYNSANLLPRTLTALRDQDFPRNELEILVVDGGSRDNTRQIASEFGAKVIDNPRTVPGWAKYLGLHQAKGKIAVYLDSDEVFVHQSALSNMAKTFRENPDVHMVTSSGYVSPPGYPFVNSYINEFGDPFTAFVYGISKDFRWYLKTMLRRYKCAKQTDAYALFDFGDARDLPLIELYAMGSALDLEYFRREFPEQFNSETEFSHAFNIFLSKSHLLGLARGAELYHYSADSWKTFFSKIDWRVKNNIAFRSSGARGFLGRVKYQGWPTKLRRWMFIPYSLLVVPVALDSLRLMITRRDLRYIGHIPFCIYTSLSILYFSVRYRLGWRPTMQAYGEKKAISAAASRLEAD